MCKMKIKGRLEDLGEYKIRRDFRANLFTGNTNNNRVRVMVLNATFSNFQ